MSKTPFKNIRVGMIFDTGTKTLDGTKNYAKVTKIPFFKKRGDRKDIFYAIFVNPKNFKEKRIVSDREFAVWDFDYKKNKWKLV